MLTLHNHDFVFCVISVFIPFLSFTTQSVIITYALTDIQTKNFSRKWKRRSTCFKRNVDLNRKFFSGIDKNHVKEFCGKKWPLNMDGPLMCTCFLCNVWWCIRCIYLLGIYKFYKKVQKWRWTKRTWHKSELRHFTCR